jgi:protein required for attachment to host cells
MDKTESATRLVGEVCEHLERARRRSAFDRLYVVSPPAFLGLMRKCQSTALSGLIASENAKEVTTQWPDQIRARLPQQL